MANATVQSIRANEHIDENLVTEMVTVGNQEDGVGSIATRSAEPSAGDNPSNDTGYLTSLRDSLKTFWRRQVSATVAHEACRDHLALERTFLGYMRTSLALAILAVLLAQLFRLQHTEHPNNRLGYFVLGIPLASVFIVGALIIQLLGTYRFWRQQNALLRGKVHAGGWELNAIGLLFLVVVLTLFVLLLAVDIKKET